MKIVDEKALQNKLTWEDVFSILMEVLMLGEMEWIWNGTVAFMRKLEGGKQKNGFMSCFSQNSQRRSLKELRPMQNIKESPPKEEWATGMLNIIKSDRAQDFK